ncbi:XRE family transcriptional regulator [Flavobacterium hungaricum]|nr:helix-turn-helix transcriptional regulator [Flavobacterium hungaricum]
MHSIGERIKQSMENKGFTPYKLHKLTSVSQSTIGRILKNENEPNRSTIEAISKVLEVNPDWITTGEGVKAKKYTENEEEVIKNKNGNKFQELPNGKFIMTVPLVPVRAYAQYISECSEVELIDGYNEVNFYVDKYARGNYVAFEIKGDSMDNGGLYDNPEGCITLCRELSRMHWDSLRDSKYGWVIVHKDTIICKDIVDQDLEKGTITCHSRNKSPEYQDFKIELNDVLQIFKVIKRTF